MTADISIIMQRLSLHKLFLSKRKGDENILNIGSQRNDSEVFWALMSEKGYMSILEALRAVSPKTCFQRAIFWQMIQA